MSSLDANRLRVDGLQLTYDPNEPTRDTRLAVDWTDQPNTSEGYTLNSPAALTAMNTCVYHTPLHGAAQNPKSKSAGFFSSFFRKQGENDGENAGLAKVFSTLGVPDNQLQAALQTHGRTFMTAVQQKLDRRGMSEEWADFSSARIPAFLSNAVLAPREMLEGSFHWLNTCDEIQSVCSGVLGDFVQGTEAQEAWARHEWRTIFDAMTGPVPHQLTEAQVGALRSALIAFAQIRVGHSAVTFKPYTALN